MIFYKMYKNKYSMNETFENQTSYYIMLLYEYITLRTIVQICSYLPIYVKSDVYSESLL